MLTDEALQEIAARVRLDLAAGFETPEEIVESVVELLEEHEEDEVRAAAESAVESALAALRREQAGWPAVTDVDRLERAFDALEETGIVARHNFTCCQTCGVAEIADEVEASDGARGYVFYHQQDTEGAVDGHGLFLAYGSVEGSDESAQRIAGEVVAALARQGLAARWDGDVRRRISVALDWKRRPPQ